MDLSVLGMSLVSVLVYSVFGVVIFGVAFLVMVKVAPFSVVKEIEEDQNTSLAILFGSVFIGLSIIIASAIS
jgi:putative membrane protein